MLRFFALLCIFLLFKIYSVGTENFLKKPIAKTKIYDIIKSSKKKIFLVLRGKTIIFSFCKAVFSEQMF